MLMASKHEKLTGEQVDETNAIIAEKILDCKVRRSSNGRFRIWWTDSTHQLQDVQTVPRFLQDANADYQVLKHIRKHWSDSELSAFHTEFAIVVSRRLDTYKQKTTSPFFHYRPGDFSRAALAVAVDPPLVHEYSIF